MPPVGFEPKIAVLVIGPSVLVYILIENQQMHQNDHFIVMSSQMLLHVSTCENHISSLMMALVRRNMY
jgi:hypothetical protein